MQARRQRQERGAWARRHNHALVALARGVWHDRCSLDDALAQICETAAETLEVDRVNVWRLHPRHGVLRCVHAYVREGGVHNPPGFDEAFDADSDYARELDAVRVIDAADVARHALLSASYAALGDYLQRHRIRSLLDAPIRSAGQLLGVVCHEQVDSARAWHAEDEAFAASIGDYVAMAFEISRRREAEQRLRYLELHDAQTDLPNREHLLEVAHSALRPVDGDAPGLSAIHLQVQAGGSERDLDAALVVAAGALRGILGDSATLARVRDDAFALLPHRQLHETEALDLAERCVALLQAQLPGVAGGTGAQVAAGIAFARDLAAPSADALLRNAELASHRARSLGTLNHCEVYDAEHHRGMLERLRLERALREAFAQGELEVHFQPQVDLVDGRWLAAEALLRWRDPAGRLRNAGEFMAAAEGSGLIVPLGRWVLAEACAAAMTWPAAADGAPTLSVNVSARQFEQPGLVDDVAAALAASGLPPRRLCLEITETVVLADLPAAAATLARLRALGVRIALDDFGTGFCSLAYLKTLPIDVLKLDRGFVAGLPDDRHDLAIVTAITGLAHDIGIDIVAEGVETAPQAQLLRERGVRRAQGYLFAPALETAALLARFAPAPAAGATA